MLEMWARVGEEKPQSVTGELSKMLFAILGSS